jgi:hypothetical protein
MTQQPKYLELARKCLDASLRFYDRCYDLKKSVNWYSTSRVHATLAWDWIFEDLSPTQRRDVMSRLVRAIDRVLQAKPAIYRENILRRPELRDLSPGFPGPGFGNPVQGV